MLGAAFIDEFEKVANRNLLRTLAGGALGGLTGGALGSLAGGFHNANQLHDLASDAADLQGSGGADYREAKDRMIDRATEEGVPHKTRDADQLRTSAPSRLIADQFETITGRGGRPYLRGHQADLLDHMAYKGMTDLGNIGAGAGIGSLLGGLVARGRKKNKFEKNAGGFLGNTIKGGLGGALGGAIAGGVAGGMGGHYADVQDLQAAAPDMLDGLMDNPDARKAALDLKRVGLSLTDPELAKEVNSFRDAMPDFVTDRLHGPKANIMAGRMGAGGTLLGGLYGLAQGMGEETDKDRQRLKDELRSQLIQEQQAARASGMGRA